MNNTKQQNVSYVGPFITMVILMALVGFITVLNQQFQAPLQAAYLSKSGEIKNTLATLITFSFFLAYLVIGPASAKSLAKVGYRGTLLKGLLILVLALIVFEISAYYFEAKEALRFVEIREQLKNMTLEELDKYKYSGEIDIPFSYYIFLVGSFLAGAALTFLQSAINPYLVACEVKGTSGVQRQTIAGAANSTMSTFTPYFVGAIIFGRLNEYQLQISSLFIPFGILALVVLVLYFVLRKIDLPDIPTVAANKDEKFEKSVWSFRHLALGVVAIFFYVGVEVAVGANIVLYAKSPSVGFELKDAMFLATLYLGGMLIGRLLGSGISKISANTQLVFTSVGAGILVVLSMVTGNPWLLVAVGLFHSIMWPAIFSLAIDKLGKYTDKGSGALMMGVVGGAVLPLIQGITADAVGSWTWTWIIVLIGEVYLLYYALEGYKVKQLPE